MPMTLERLRRGELAAAHERVDVQLLEQVALRMAAADQRQPGQRGGEAIRRG